MKNKKENKGEPRTSATLFYIVAAIDYLVALSYFIGGSDTTLGILWLCIGSTFLCLGAATTKNWKDGQTDVTEEESDEKPEE